MRRGNRNGGETQPRTPNVRVFSPNPSSQNYSQSWMCWNTGREILAMDCSASEVHLFQQSVEKERERRVSEREREREREREQKNNEEIH